MKPHLKVILNEMFNRVGAAFDPDMVGIEGWYLKHEWTEEQQSDFALWMQDYLLANAKARKEIMRISVKNKQVINRVIDNFLGNYGWKVKTMTRRGSSRHG